MGKIVTEYERLIGEVRLERSRPFVGKKRKEGGELILKEHTYGKKIRQKKKLTKAILACPERVFKVDCFALGPKQNDKKKTILPPSLLKSRPQKKAKLPPIRPDLLKCLFPLPEDFPQSPLAEDPTCFFPKAMEEELRAVTDKTNERLKILNEFVDTL